MAESNNYSMTAGPIARLDVLIGYKLATNKNRVGILI